METPSVIYFVCTRYGNFVAPMDSEQIWWEQYSDAQQAVKDIEEEDAQHGSPLYCGYPYKIICYKQSKENE